MFTRVPSDYPAGRRRPVLVLLGILFAIYLVLTAAGTLWTDFLWFDSVGFRGVWLRNWGLSILLGAIGVGFSFLIIWGALKLVDRFSPRWAPFDLSEEEELVERFREWIEPRIRQIRILITAGLAVIMGLTVATWRDDVFLFMNSQSFGVDDAIFGVDLSFYIFRLPLWETAVDWLFNLLVLTTVVVAIALYLNGAIRFDGRRVTATRGAKIYVSSLFALIAIVRAISYRLDMFETLYANRNDTFFGPGFTDITARLPVIRLLLIVALIAAVLFIVNIFRRGWTLAIVSVSAWVVVSIAAGTIYPAFVQRFSVEPDERNKETEYIGYNMEATKAAWMLDDIEVREFLAADDLTAEDIDANQTTIDNLRIWNTSVLPRTYQNFQELERYYTLSNVDTDRYVADGSPNQVMLAVRELDELEVPQDNWQNEHLFYTHGYGAVVNQANVVQADGQPVFLLRDVPPVASDERLELEEPRVYFGETYTEGSPVIVKTGSTPQEIDIPLGGGATGFNEYDGESGVVLDNFFKRIAFAFRYRDLNLLISNQIRPDSRVLVERNIKAIVEQLTPFLAADSDPYPVILDGEILWVLDMYTTTANYPYSQRVTPDARARLRQVSGVRLGTNYIRNSVKAVIDAHNGDVTFYRFDPDDPIINAWNATHPGLFVDASEMPERLENHLRFPQDMFRLQTYMYLKYHVNEENQLFSGNDEWSIPRDISGSIRTGDEVLWGDLPDGTQLEQMLPYYLLTELPGENQLSYLLLQPFNPRARRNMVSFLVADSTPGNYGRLIDFRMPDGELVDGAEQAGQRIEQDAEIAQQLTLWQGEGSKVIKGDLLIVPIEDSVVYFQPIFLEEEGGAFPEFRRVAVVYADQVEWADSLEGALSLVFGPGDGDGDNDGDGDGEVPGDTSTLEELIQEADDAFTAAEAALRNGDLAGYQQWVREAQSILEEIADLVAGEQPNAGVLHPL